MLESRPTSSPNSVFEVLSRRAREQGERLAYRFISDGRSAECLSYAEVYEQARRVANLLHAHTKPGDRVILLYPSGLDFVCAFWGGLAAGVIVAPACLPRNVRQMPRLEAIVRDCGARIALTNSNSLKRLHGWIDAGIELTELGLLSTDQLPTTEDSGGKEPAFRKESPALLQYTSGSTASPKGVIVTHGSLLHNSEYIAEGFAHTSQSVSVSWLPMFHDMGLIDGVVQPVYSGFPCTFLASTAFLQRPYLWLKAISDYRATHSGGPDFAYELCVRRTTVEQRRELDLSSWTIAYSGAEPVRSATLHRFLEAFAEAGMRWNKFYPCYGLAESTLKTTGGAAGDAPVVFTVDSAELERHRVVKSSDKTRRQQSFVGCGRASAGMRVEIVNPDSRSRCLPDEIGEIWISGESVACGYWNQPEQTERTFEAYLADEGSGPFLRTGDLGFIDGGELFVTGRFKDLIVIRGLNHYPQDIEETMQGVDAAFSPGSGVAFSIDENDQERLVLVQELNRRQLGDAEHLLEKIRRRVAEVHDVDVHEICLVRPASIPKTTSGKLQRKLCRTWFLEGKLDIVAIWRAENLVDTGEREIPQSVTQITKDAIQTQILSWLAARYRLAAADLDAEIPCMQYGLDSLATAELVYELERNFGAGFRINELLAEFSASQIAERVVAQLREAKAPLRSSRFTEDDFVLSQGQQALWFLREFNPASDAAYNIARALRVRTAIDVDRLRRAFQGLLERHASLRSTFAMSEGKPTQRIPVIGPVAFHHHDVSSQSEQELHSILMAEANSPLDLERGPIFKVHLYTRAEQDHVLLLIVHHIISDFWSLVLLMNELALLYEAEETDGAGLPLVTTEFREFVLWQEELLAGPEGERLRAYWKGQLPNGLTGLNLPVSRPGPRNQNNRGSRETFAVDEEVVLRLRDLARAQNTTFYVIVLAAFQTLLSRYTGQEEITVVSPFSGRTRTDFLRTVGYFVNVLPLRAVISKHDTFIDVVARVRNVVSGAITHQDYPFAAIARDLESARGKSATMADVMFVLHQSFLPDLKELTAMAAEEANVRFRLGELELESMSLDQNFAQFDLTLTMAEVGNQLAASFNYSTDVFEAETIRHLAVHFQVLLRSIAAEPQKFVWQHSLLDDDERVRVLRDWNPAGDKAFAPTCVHEMFERQVERTPQAIAAVCGDQSITYADLDRRANQLAQQLHACGVRAEMRIAVAVERSIEMLVALLGVLKSGGAYLPLDVQYPQERLSFMLEESESSILITQLALVQQIQPAEHVEVICLDRDLKTTGRQSDDQVLTTVYPENLAYVIYTSGSTGKPKGVAITHHAASAMLHWAMQEFSEAELRGVLASTSICFDLSVFEIFVPLVTGGTVIVAANALELSEQTCEWPVTLINTVPSAMTELLRVKAVPKSVCTINLAGEPLTATLIENAYAEPQVQRVLNLYGPTEYTTYTTCGQMPRASAKVTIGRPLPNSYVYILDDALEPVAAGVVGEIYIGGSGLARGYLNQPGLTAERFIPDPFSNLPGARLYRTGDVARHRADGEIEFLGRIDHQLKIRGYRIELGEIETVLCQHPDIQAAVVISSNSRAGGPRLVGYAVAARKFVQAAELIDHLRQQLPEYMVPREIVMLERFPLTPNGKLDRAALPEPPLPGYAKDQKPRTDIERALAGIWADILERPDLSVEADFFELGGHSLIAMQVVSRIEEELQVKLPVRCLFDSPTIARLAQTISEYKATQAAVDGLEVDHSGQELLTFVADLSDAEIDFLYAEMLAEQRGAE